MCKKAEERKCNNMRDPERIPALTGKLAEYWLQKAPDWRFGQLTFNLLTWATNKTGTDCFYIEDDKWPKLLDEFFGGLDHGHPELLKLARFKYKRRKRK